MGWLLRKCGQCEKYTLKQDKCPYCGEKVRVPHPPKFSPDDKYLRYRMALKREASTK
ncbi:MAG: RNA-protein complex protein Nop10 [Candidatus Bathyarchaeota archaeon]|nr:RNA-protein complex protein Nop10 [Candidatus Bathyarchaeota archaeon]MDH5788640.1 RNA-protein complex protein Nop10 [Candidatus Bathyarchaeota archaeon]